MEEFGPIAIDYFSGRVVSEVLDGDAAKEAAFDEGDVPVWIIRFDGGGEIHNFAPTVSAAPKELVGLTLTLSTLEGAITKMYFGNRANPRQSQVRLDPTQYAIKDDTYTQGNLVYAQRSTANMPPKAEDMPDAEPPENRVEEHEDDGA